VALLLSLLPLIAFVWAVFSVDWVRSSACTEPRVQSALAGVDYCRGFMPVPAAEAELTFDQFIEAASGAQPERAWEMLSETERAESSREEFIEKWLPALWAERIGRAEPTDVRDRYLLRYRVYLGDNNEVSEGDVPYFRREVAFNHTGSQILVTDLAREARDADLRLTFPWIVTREDVATRQEPDGAAQYVWTAKAGGGLRSLCQTQVGDEWWSSTPLGWIPHKGLVGGDTSVSGGYLCEDQHAQKVLLGRAEQGGTRHVE
jgi:hypothetical protein